MRSQIEDQTGRSTSLQQELTQLSRELERLQHMETSSLEEERKRLSEAYLQQQELQSQLEQQLEIQVSQAKEWDARAQADQVRVQEITQQLATLQAEKENMRLKYNAELEEKNLIISTLRLQEASLQEESSLTVLDAKDADRERLEKIQIDLDTVNQELQNSRRLIDELSAQLTQMSEKNKEQLVREESLTKQLEIQSLIAEQANLQSQSLDEIEARMKDSELYLLQAIEKNQQLEAQIREKVSCDFNHLNALATY